MQNWKRLELVRNASTANVGSTTTHIVNCVGQDVTTYDKTGAVTGLRKTFLCFSMNRKDNQNHPTAQQIEFVNSHLTNLT